jgi:hypothetical protein
MHALKYWNGKKIKIENDHSQNITPQQPNLQHVQGSPMPMGYEQFKDAINLIGDSGGSVSKIGITTEGNKMGVDDYKVITILTLPVMSLS